MGPSYASVGNMEKTCTAIGGTAGSNFVEGTVFLEKSYGYHPSNLWRLVHVLINSARHSNALFLEITAS
jgi:hypothetical protein